VVNTSLLRTKVIRVTLAEPQQVDLLEDMLVVPWVEENVNQVIRIVTTMVVNMAFLEEENASQVIKIANLALADQ